MGKKDSLSVKLRILCVGKLSGKFLRQGVEEFAGRVGRYLPLTEIELKEEKGGGKKADPDFIREREAERILARIPQQAFVVALDEKGKGLSSEELAAELENHMIKGTSELVFIIGGAYGLSPSVKQRSHLLLSLSAMTFTHQMARLFLLEQVYRAFTIIRNQPYHNR